MKLNVKQLGPILSLFVIVGLGLVNVQLKDNYTLTALYVVPILVIYNYWGLAASIIISTISACFLSWHVNYHTDEELQLFWWNLIMRAATFWAMIGGYHGFKKNFEASQKLKLAEELAKQREDLLREMHHRIANNLSMVQGLMAIQSHDPETRKLISPVERRIQAMAELHRRLYQTKDMGFVNAKVYIYNLVQSMINTYDLPKLGINIQSDIDDIILDAEHAQLIGMVLNELITNSYKHGFAYGNGGFMAISFKQAPKGVMLTFKDNGKGFTNEQLIAGTGIGKQLVDDFVLRMNGKWLEKSGIGGAHYQIWFEDLPMQAVA